MSRHDAATKIQETERRAVSALFVWSALFALGENGITAALVYGRLLAHQPHSPEDLSSVLGLETLGGLAAAFIVTFAGSLWAGKRYLSRAVTPLLSEGRGRRRLSRDDLDRQVELFNALATNLVVWSILGYLVCLGAFVGLNTGLAEKFPPGSWLPSFAFGGLSAPLLFSVRIKVLSPEPLSRLRRFPLYQVLAVLISLAASLWLWPGSGAHLVTFVPLVAGVFLVIVWSAYVNDQELGRRPLERPTAEPESEPQAPDAREPRAGERPGRRLPGHSIWRNSFDGPGEVFLIHGHDRGLRIELKAKLKEWGVRSITLKDEPAGGTEVLLNLFEDIASKCDFAIALLTPDDNVQVVQHGQEAKYESRARPNVIFEIGWFLGNKGRRRLCLLEQKGTALPSNLGGVRSLKFSEDLNEISRELWQVLEIWELVEEPVPGH